MQPITATRPEYQQQFSQVTIGTGADASQQLTPNTVELVSCPAQTSQIQPPTGYFA